MTPCTLCLEEGPDPARAEVIRKVQGADVDLCVYHAAYLDEAERVEIVHRKVKLREPTRAPQWARGR